MRGVFRHTTVGGDRDRRSGRWPISSAATATVAGLAAAAGVALIGAPSAVADPVPGPASTAATTAEVAQADPTVFGLNALGVFWLLAALVALVVGLVLATRRQRPAAPLTGSNGPATSPPSTSPPSTPRSSMSTTPLDPGGARK